MVKARLLKERKKKSLIQYCCIFQRPFKMSMMRRQAMTRTRADEEKMRADDRRKESQKDDHMRLVAQDKSLRATLAADERVENKRFIRRLQQETKESEMAQRIEAAAIEREIKEKQQEQEARLAKEMEKLKWEQNKDERYRQQIRENSLELRELEAKLKAGYMNKERAAQLAEKDSMKKKEKMMETEMTLVQQREYEKDKELEQQKEKEKIEQSIRYQKELESQLEEQERKRQEAYEEFLKEKLMIDEICRKIYEEDQRELQARLEKQQATRQYISEFVQKRQEWKELERELMEEENRRILEFSHQQQAREEQRIAAMKEQEDAKAVAQQYLTEKITAMQLEGEEMDRIRTELYLEEQEERERQKEKAAIEAQLRHRLDLQGAHKSYLEFKAKKLQAEKEEEEMFRQQMMAKFAEDDRIEQMNAQKRRMKQLEHRREVERLIDVRRTQFQAEKEAELEQRKDEERREASRKVIIEQERQRLLQEHASKLLGYLPKGVLRGSQDLDVLGSEFKEAYTRRQVDPFEDL
ncbi:meiosis-specific nuclear structural protein 1-like [Halichondria panicea]|uniref:meiosis-specific nuclear structural protein 1-like n=1 Tax=Halichondria panicea TaxID=6063 RepID=UPI00312BC953